MLYNTTYSDTLLFWVSLSNSDYQSKMIEFNNFDTTSFPCLICSRYSQVKESHPTSLPFFISQGAYVQNTIRCTLCDFLFVIFTAITGLLIWNVSQSSSHYSWQYITLTVSHCLWTTCLLALSFILGDIVLNSL